MFGSVAQPPLGVRRWGLCDAVSPPYCRKSDAFAAPWAPCMKTSAAELVRGTSAFRAASTCKPLQKYQLLLTAEFPGYRCPYLTST